MILALITSTAIKCSYQKLVRLNGIFLLSVPRAIFVHLWGKFHLLKRIFIYLYKAVYGSHLQLVYSGAAELKSTEI